MHLAELKGEVNQGRIFLDKRQYALLNETVVRYRLSEHFFSYRDTRRIEIQFSKEKFLTVFLQSFSI